MRILPLILPLTVPTLRNLLPLSLLSNVNPPLYFKINCCHTIGREDQPASLQQGDSAASQSGILG
jgi:hypothetical protein